LLGGSNRCQRLSTRQYFTESTLGTHLFGDCHECLCRRSAYDDNQEYATCIQWIYKIPMTLISSSSFVSWLLALTAASHYLSTALNSRTALCFSTSLYPLSSFPFDSSLRIATYLSQRDPDCKEVPYEMPSQLRYDQGEQQMSRPCHVPTKTGTLSSSLRTHVHLQVVSTDIRRLHSLLPSCT
jgi:hypothetical protein